MKKLENIKSDKNLFKSVMEYIDSVKELEKISADVDHKYNLDTTLKAADRVNKNIDYLTKYLNTDYGLDSQEANAMVTGFCFQMEGE